MAHGSEREMNAPQEERQDIRCWCGHQQNHHGGTGGLYCGECNCTSFRADSPAAPEQRDLPKRPTPNGLSIYEHEELHAYMDALEARVRTLSEQLAAKEQQ